MATASRLNGRRSFLAGLAASPLAGMLIAPPLALSHGVPTPRAVELAKPDDGPDDPPPAAALELPANWSEEAKVERYFQMVRIRPDGTETVVHAAMSEVAARAYVAACNERTQQTGTRAEARPLDLTTAAVSPLAYEFPAEPKRKPWRERRKRGPEHTPKYAVARAMQKATKGRLRVSYEPTAFLNRDGRTMKSRGHLFNAHLDFRIGDEHPDTNWIWVDDRKGDVPTLLAAELRRVAAVYERLAREVEGRAA